MSEAYPQLEEIYKRLIGLGRLEWNWDGNGANKIEPESISNSSLLMLFLVDRIRPYQVNPLPTGRVELRWCGPLGELIIEVTRKDRMLYQLIPNKGCGTECWSNGEIHSFEELLKLLVKIWIEVEETRVVCDACKRGRSISRSMLPY
jgi:hypothetical protein